MKHYRFAICGPGLALVALTVLMGPSLADQSSGDRVSFDPAAAPSVERDPFIGLYQGTFHPQGWSAGSWRRARPDTPGEVEAMERDGIDPAALDPEVFFSTLASNDAAAPRPGEPMVPGYGGNEGSSATKLPPNGSQPPLPIRKAHRCAACHTTASVEAAGEGYLLTFYINHGTDKEGRLVREKRLLKGSTDGQGAVVFRDAKYDVQLAGGLLTGRYVGRMTGRISLARQVAPGREGASASDRDSGAALPGP